MEFKVSFEAGTQSVKLSVRFILCWPPLLNATTSNLIRGDTLWMITLCFLIYEFIDLLIIAYNAQNDAAKLRKIYLELAVIFIPVFKIIFSIIQHSGQQICIVTVMKFLKMINSRRREILQRCEYRFPSFYSFFETLVVFFMVSELIFPQISLPSNVCCLSGWHDSSITETLLSFLQFFATFLSTMGEVTHLEILELLWFAEIRFKIFAEEFMMATSSSKFDKCIVKLHRVLASVNESDTVAGVDAAVSIVTFTSMENNRFLSGGFLFLKAFARLSLLR